jgi:hypothetical protein
MLVGVFFSEAFRDILDLRVSLKALSFLTC